MLVLYTRYTYGKLQASTFSILVLKIPNSEPTNWVRHNVQIIQILIPALIILANLCLRWVQGLEQPLKSILIKGRKDSRPMTVV